MKKKTIVGLSLTLAILSQQVYAESVEKLQNKENELKENVSQSKKQKENLEKELKSVQEQISSLKKQLEVITNKVNETEKQITLTTTKIKETEESIEKREKEIIVKTEELYQKRDKIKENLNLMYSKGEVKLLEFLLRSESMSQFIYRFEVMNDILGENKKIYETVKKELAYIEEQKKILEEEKKKLVDTKNNLDNLKQTQITQKQEQEKIKSELESKEKNIEVEIEAEEKAINDLMLNISVTEEQIAAAKKAAEAARNQTSQSSSDVNNQVNTPINSNLGNGQLALPMQPGNYRISSGYGYRIHPVHGTKSLHNGVDFAAPVGSNIFAAEEGYVVFAGPARGYGNWIVLRHPNGLYTIYGHMYSNGVLVSQGQYVSRGQLIGKVGNAGTSTGAHLHFCVATSYSGGKFTYADPMGYLQ